jgi:hypothetical protein
VQKKSSHIRRFDGRKRVAWAPDWSGRSGVRRSAIEMEFRPAETGLMQLGVGSPHMTTAWMSHQVESVDGVGYLSVRR